MRIEFEVSIGDHERAHDLDSIPNLLARWLDGDQRAAEEVFDQYSQRLARLASQYMSRRLAGRFDEDDVVQSVFRTFFSRSARGDFEIRNSVELWQLLVRITITKVRMNARRHTYAKRDVNREIASPEDWVPQAMTREPGPEEAATLVDEIEHLLEGLPTHYGDILTLRLSGNGPSEIATELGVSRQTVHRVLTLFKTRLSEDPNT